MAGSWLEGGGNGHEVDVADVFDALAVQAFAEIVQAGALLSLGTTSDGGALGITVTVDGKYRREYVRSADELHAWASEAVPGVTELTGGSRPSAAPRGRARRSK